MWYSIYDFAYSTQICLFQLLPNGRQKFNYKLVQLLVQLEYSRDIAV